MAKKVDHEMIAAARAGYVGSVFGKNPYLASSPLGIAYDVGAWKKAKGGVIPADVRMSRGCKVHVDGMLVEWKAPGQIERIN